MMIATNWGVYEIGMRDTQFKDAGDLREMQIRARTEEHLDNLRQFFSPLGPTVYLGHGVADFQYRVYISRSTLTYLMAELALDVDYVKFKEGALARKDHKLYGLLSSMWRSWLVAYPKGSSYTVREVPKGKKRWYED